MPSFRQRGEDYAKKVSSELIEQIREGVAPWQKPWQPGEKCTPEGTVKLSSLAAFSPLAATAKSLILSL